MTWPFGFLLPYYAFIKGFIQWMRWTLTGQLPYLCNRCQVLQINDKAQGGVVSDVDDSSYITFGPKDQQRIDLDVEYYLEDEYPGLPRLSASASAGCAFCVYLKYALQMRLDSDLDLDSVRVPDLDQQRNVKVVVYKLSYDYERVDDREMRPLLGKLSVFYRLWGALGDWEEHALRFDVHAVWDDPCTRWLGIRRRVLAPHPLSDAGLHRMKELIQQSLDHVPFTHTYLPTRLIDVGCNDDPCLIISSDHPPFKDPRADDESKRYVALSYCWGPPQDAQRQLKTEVHSIADRLKGIKVDQLPRTVLEAVVLCRSLGVRYLWVDALCIIQGDLEDWSRESGKMASVYKNAFLTVVAAEGSSCVKGFLGRELPPTIYIPFVSSFKRAIKGGFSLFLAPTRGNVTESRDNYIRNGVATFRSAMYEPFEEDIDACAWNWRAWTFQEASLSPRMLIFGRTMVHICYGEWCESEDGSIRHQYKWTMFASGHPDPDDPPEPTKPTGPRVGRSERVDWYFLAGSYSPRALSYSSDKLPAISALASFKFEREGGEYLAGLWVDSLHRGLLWGHTRHITDPGAYLKTLEAPEEYVAPSWSWASQPQVISWVHGVTQVENLEFKPEFQYLDNNLESELENRFGRVKAGGKLFLSARLRRMPTLNIRRDPAELGFRFPYVLATDNGEYIAQLRFDWRNAYVEGPKNLETGKEDIAADGPIDQVFMILVASRSLTSEELDIRSGSGIEDPEVMFGLLLLPLTENDSATERIYRRVGIFYSERRGLGGRKLWDDVESSRISLV